MKKILKKLGSIIVSCVPLLVSFAVQAVVIIPVLFYYCFIKGISGSLNVNFFINMQNLIIEGDFLTYTLLVWAILNGIICLVWYKKVHDKKNDLKVRDNLNTLTIIGLLLTLIGSHLVIDYGVTELSKVIPKTFGQYEQLMSFTNLSGFAAVLMSIYAIVIGPIHEEIVFRGLTLHFTKKIGPFLVANLIQAILFGVMHLNVIQGAYAFLIGLVLGYIYYKTRNLIIPIIFHMCFNLVGSISLFKDVSKRAPYATFVVIAIGVLLFFFGLYIFTTGIKLRDEDTQN